MQSFQQFRELPIAITENTYALQIQYIDSVSIVELFVVANTKTDTVICHNFTMFDISLK